MARNRTEKVYLHVYDLAWFNQYVSWAGVGAFHSGVYIYGAEICFGGHQAESSGIFKVPPKFAPGAIFREAILIGETKLSHNEIDRVIDQMGRDFTGASYHLVNRNCNHFADAFCEKVVGKGIPGWVNRLAFMGSYVSCVLPPELGGPINAPEPSQGTSLSTSSNQRVPNVPIFSGSGQTLGSTGTSTSPDDVEVLLDSASARRERAARAALNRHSITSSSQSS